MGERLQNVREVKARLGISDRQVFKLLSAGKLPEPVRLGRSVRWREADLDLFIQLECDMPRYRAAREGRP